MMEDELPAGATVLDGRYEVIGCLGVGGSASVYRARGRGGDEVALKVLLATRARSLYEVKRLEREFHFGRTLRYIEGIVPALEHGLLPELQERPYITFPLLEGEELDYKLTAGPLSPLHARTVLARLARVVAKIHEAGVLHRDIKPSNVMLGPDGTVSLLDFGHARRLEDQGSPSEARDLTRARELPGTRHYMAPEQALGGPPSPSWDVYGLGMTLYEALVGDCAYSDLSARESLQRRCNPDVKPLSIRNRRPDVPTPLAAFVDRCLAYDPERRPASAAAFAEQLEAIELPSAASEDAATTQRPGRQNRPRSGMQLGHYSLISKLGEGGCATVYEAHDTRNDTTVALKVLIERYRGRPEREALFDQEADALRRIGPHPNIVGLIEQGRIPGLDWPYLALELVQGHSAEDLIAEGATGARRVTDIAMQVALALREAHRAGVVHRDLTPSNVLLDREAKRAVLIDFSHSGSWDSPRVPAGHPQRRTRHGEVPGSSQAMSPEQARAAPPTRAMDVYAFGVLLFQLLTARAPFPEYMDRDIFIALQSRDHLGAPLLSAKELPDAPPKLIALVNACVQPDAAERPTISDVVRTLEEVLASMAMPAPPMTEFLETPKELVELPEPAPLPTPPTPPAPPAGKVSRVIAYGVLIVAGLLLIFSLANLASQANTSQPAANLEPEPPRAPSQAALVPRAPTDPPGEAAAEQPEPPAEPAPPTPPEPSVRVAPRPQPATRQPPSDPPPTPEPSPEPAEVEDPQEPASQRCSGRTNQARTATKRQDWGGVLRATKNAACWTDQHERRKLRLAALRNAGKYEACVELATKVGDHRTAKFCSKRLPPTP